jgi:hypothetical protein
MRRLSLLAALALASACAPISAYRYTAFTPTARPIAWDGAPSERGEVHVEASATLVYAVGLSPSYALGEGGKLGNVFLLLAVHTDFKNDGFTSTQSAGSTIQTAGLVPVVGGGASVHVGPMKVGATVFAPFVDGSAGHQRPGGMVTFGFDGKP